jgi:hypothetical protein
MTRYIAFALVLVAAPAAPTTAQPPSRALEGAYGGAWFVDEQPIHHHVWSGRFGWPITPRISVGPEAAWMIGPDSDRDFSLTGNVVYTFRDRGVTPYIVGGAGLFRHSEQFNGRPFTSTEGTFTAGAGVRVPIGRGWYLAPDVRVGWELHSRIQLGIGILL